MHTLAKQVRIYPPSIGIQVDASNKHAIDDRRSLRGEFHSIAFACATSKSIEDQPLPAAASDDVPVSDSLDDESIPNRLQNKADELFKLRMRGRSAYRPACPVQNGPWRA